MSEPRRLRPGETAQIARFPRLRGPLPAPPGSTLSIATPRVIIRQNSSRASARPKLRAPPPARYAEAKVTRGLRIGIGHDTHRLAPGGPLRLGGVDVPHDRHAEGHSDADALLHAVTDALLGAAALGDIGELFPDTDPANRGLDSAVMLERAHDAIRQAGWQIVNLDCIVFAERPKLSRYKDSIRRRIAEILGIAATEIGLQAKTGEGVDAVGRQEAIMTQCVVLLTAESSNRA